MQNVNDCKILSFEEHNNDGKLTVIESLKQIPFSIKRIFYIYEVNSDKIRGQHANRNSDFVMFVVKGNVKVKVFDGNEYKTMMLEDPSRGLFIPKMIWKDMYAFSKDCILMVLTNEYYDENEYIRDKEEYVKEMKNGKD